MLKVDIVLGGHTGAYGRCYAHSTVHGLGVAFSDQSESDSAVARLLDNVEAKTGQPCVVGIVAEAWETTSQEKLHDNDPNDRYDPSKVKVKKKAPKRKAKPAWQPEEWGGGWEKGLER